ncbi:MAG: hypothetical protein ACYC8V_05290 [Caulobacteraceae bacterium]
MESLWIPAVYNAGRFGRWAFLEIEGVPYGAEKQVGPWRPSGPWPLDRSWH